MRKLNDELPELARHRASPCISLYIPLPNAGQSLDRAEILAKNLLRHASDLLASQSVTDSPETALASQRSSDDDDEHSGIRSLRSMLEDSRWLHRFGDSMVIFHAEDVTRFYPLPRNIEPLCVVSDRFHLKPVIAALGHVGRHSVLALSEGEVRLLRVRWNSPERVYQPQLPIDLRAERGQAGPSIQFHSGHGHGRSPIYHGHGESKGRSHLEAAVRAVDQALRSSSPRLVASDEPLVLAGVSSLTSLFRRQSRHPHIVDQDIEGNVEAVSDQELAERARPLAERSLRAGMRRAQARVRNLAHTHLVQASLLEIPRAAFEGRIEALFLRENEQCWGAFEEATLQVRLDGEQSASNQDLLDYSAMQVLGHGGEVYVVPAHQMPFVESTATAILRY